jgi:hypothetical protein
MGFLNRFIDLACRPVPIRTLLAQKLIRRFPVGSYSARLKAGCVDRPWYGWCLYSAALEAKLLGYKAVTAIEMGVASGEGLVCLCGHRDEIQKELGIDIILQGFDTGVGLPKSADPRDLLYCWPPGSFEMDQDLLKARLEGRAEVVIGDVANTVERWHCTPERPIGAVLFDLDYYSSTCAALKILRSSHVLPRVWCYMDDICGYPENAYSDSTGVRQAIKEFNASEDRELLHDHLSQAFVFRELRGEPWHEQVYIYHRLCHTEYNRCLSKGKHQLHLGSPRAIGQSARIKSIPVRACSHY